MASAQPSAVQPKNSAAQWLRPAMLGASDGIVLVETLMLATGADTQTAKSMLAALIAGAFGKAIREYLSVCSQVDFKLAQIEEEKKYAAIESSAEEEMEKLPSPLQVAGASALAFAIGAVLPLLAGGFISQHRIRIGVVSCVSTLALALFGWAGAILGGTPICKPTVRLVGGGWAAIIVTYAILKLFGFVFKMDTSR